MVTPFWSQAAFSGQSESPRGHSPGFVQPEKPSPMNPSGQRHTKLPIVFSQMPVEWHGLFRHSSISSQPCSTVWKPGLQEQWFSEQSWYTWQSLSDRQPTWQYPWMQSSPAGQSLSPEHADMQKSLTQASPMMQPLQTARHLFSMQDKPLGQDPVHVTTGLLQPMIGVGFPVRPSGQ